MGKNPAGENPHGEYLCSLSVKKLLKIQQTCFQTLYFNSRICQNKISFLYNFLVAAGFFLH